MTTTRSPKGPSNGQTAKTLQDRKRGFWDIEDNGACFIVRDANGQALSHIYYETEPGRRTAADLMTREEARRIAMNIAKLPELLGAALKQDRKPAYKQATLNG